jgi:hypothetical protein
MATLRINAKCSDLCIAELINDKGESVVEHDGYVPEGLNLGGQYEDGDYVEIDIDIKTGQILNWKPLTEKQVIAALKKD